MKIVFEKTKEKIHDMYCFSIKKPGEQAKLALVASLQGSKRLHGIIKKNQNIEIVYLDENKDFSGQTEIVYAGGW